MNARILINIIGYSLALVGSQVALRLVNGEIGLAVGLAVGLATYMVGARL